MPAVILSEAKDLLLYSRKADSSGCALRMTVFLKPVLNSGAVRAARPFDLELDCIAPSRHKREVRYIE
jgi:hypothetical protein